MRSLSLVFFAAAFSAALSHVASATTFIGGLDGVSDSSTFAVAATTPLPTLGWVEETNATRVFAADTGADILIHASSSTGLYSALYSTGVNFVEGDTYDLTVVVGAATPNPGSASYEFGLGTLDGLNNFVSISQQIDSLVGSDLGGQVTGSGENTVTDLLSYTALASDAGQEIVVRVARTGGAGRWFGYDTVTLSAVPEPGTLGLLALAGMLAIPAIRRTRRRAAHRGRTTGAGRRAMPARVGAKRAAVVGR